MKASTSRTGRTSGKRSATASRPARPRCRALVAEQHLIGLAQRLDFVAREAAALQPDDVEAGEPRAVADHRAVGNHVALHAGDAADHGMLADPHKLMHRREAAEQGKVLDHDMASQRRVVGHDHMVADDAVMGDMDAHPEKAAVAHPRHHAAALGAGIHRHVLADDVALADDKARGLAAVFQILRLMADRGEGKDARPLADRRAPGDGDMGQRARRRRRARPRGRHDAEGADLHRSGEPRAGLDDRRGMDVTGMRPLSWP